MGRRRFLNTVAGLGASAGAVAGMSQSVMADLIDDPKREVPRVHSYVHTNHEAVKDGASPEREPIYYKIPRSQWRRVESAHDARKQIEDKLKDRPEPTAVWVTTNSNDEKQIEVSVYDSGDIKQSTVRELEDTLPSTVTGVAGRDTMMEDTVQDIPISVDQISINTATPRPQGDEPEYFWHEWDEIPGGSGFVGDIYDGSDHITDAWWTSCTPVDDNGTTKMVTAGHNITVPPLSGETRLIYGRPPTTGVDFIPEEEVVDFPIDEPSGPETFDAAILDPATDTEVTYELARGNGMTGNDILGVVAEDNLKDIEENGTMDGESFQRQGSRTGTSLGFGIEKLGSEAYVTTLDEDETDTGDSGGPYHLATSPSEATRLVMPDEIMSYPEPISEIAGVHHGNASEHPYTIATSMYRVEEKFGVTI
ncbi:hypothetical protein [Halopiger goleimassiliensis]|uniref:hypothetical protein n=1 Tax=Halopiger goleimassiliensis TaxID=1293048 RepID=UPI0012B5C9A6|nr:hypothetical protein [Halopiger goleimassiliensis]